MRPPTSHKYLFIKKCIALFMFVQVAAQPIYVIGKELQKEGRKGGSYTWPVNILQLTLEMLVNGTPPAAMSASKAGM